MKITYGTCLPKGDKVKTGTPEPNVTYPWNMPIIDKEKQAKLKQELAEKAKSQELNPQEKRLWEVLAQASLDNMSRKIEELFDNRKNG